VRIHSYIETEQKGLKVLQSGWTFSAFFTYLAFGSSGHIYSPFTCYNCDWFIHYLITLQHVQTLFNIELYAIIIMNNNLRGVGHVIAQAVSHWLPTMVAWVRSQVKSCGICGGQSGAGADFLWVLRFPLPILIPPTASHSSSIIRAWYGRPVSGRRTKWTQSHPSARN
jgi:hypothetical protein